MYHKFQIGEADRFNAAHFPELQTSLAKINGLLNNEAGGPVAEMLLSFVKDHSINSQFVLNHPRLAMLISTKELPVYVMEALFEDSRKNPSFRQDLEAYIRSGLTSDKRDW
jgi:hypothetical protein